MAENRWLAVGSSSVESPFEAGREAALGAVSGEHPRLLIVFSSDAYELDRMLDGIRSVAGDTPLIGCSTAGEIATDGPGSSGVVVAALGGPGFTVTTGVAERASEGLRRSGEEAARALEGVAGRPHRVLLLLTDGLAGNQQEIVRGAYRVAGASVPLVGGCAGDDLKMEATRQLHGDRILQDAVVSAAIGSDAPFGIGVRHGWRPVGEAVVVTGSEGNMVRALDDRPALDVYLERLDAPEEARRDPAAFTRFALTHPLGLSGRTGEPHVRFVGEADFETRSLVCIAEVPQSALAWFMEGDESSVLEATDAACTEALEALGGRSPIGAIAFDCIARRGVLGEEGIDREIDRIVSLTEVPVAGFYTYGEIARTRGFSGFHNQTLVLLAVA